jgi:S1-C subfamily serine protease
MQQLTAVAALPAHEQQQTPQLMAALTPAAVLDMPQQTLSSSGGSSTAHSATAALQAATAGVVMVRAGRSWGSGVLITHSGLVLTVAHLFRTGAPAAAAGAAARTTAAAAGDSASLQSGSHQVSEHSVNIAGTPAQQQQQQQQQQQDAGGAVLEARLSESGAERLFQQQEQQQQALDVSVLLSVPHNSTVNSRRKLWLPARVLHCFTGHLDLAVLQVDRAHIASLEPGLLRPLQLAGRADTVSPGDAAFVIGHGLFGPRLAWPPAITSGCVARVLLIPTPVQQQQQLGHPGSLKPSMVISTAAVHAGASGGALVDASGRLQGLVTSNARHARGATLPHLNFCISAAELRPVWEWAQRWDGGSRARDGAAGLAVLDVRGDAAGARLWALQPFCLRVGVLRGEL